ncbi:MAG: hypothetical protein A2289_04100 [Deltaproteobacteria bacterium RIFOXYA12_FULL_58_15]|nr:MAG: hypothetical protein A2289_04100 [Deltaproteobacteria bacterium RIFOXYA12_FULL_58_15]
MSGWGRAWAAAPIPVRLSADGTFSAATEVAGPAGPLHISFALRQEFADWRGHERAWVSARVTAGPTSWAAVENGTIVLGPPVEIGTFRTRQLKGESWKCLPVDERPQWMEEDHPDLATTRLELRSATASSGTDTPREKVAGTDLAFFVAARTTSLHARLELSRRTLARWTLALEQPMQLTETEGEVLRQYQRLGPALLERRGGVAGFAIVRVSTDMCGNTTLSQVSFDESNIETLAWPSPTHRFATAAGR